MNRRVWIISLSLVALIAVLASLTWCCMDLMMKRHMSQAHLSQSATWDQKLNLTAEQRAKINPLEKTFMKDVDEIQAKITQFQMDNCRTMMSSGPLDRKVLAQNLSAITDLQRRKDERTVDHLMALREILNPDQQKILLTTIMRDICQGCRVSTGGKRDYCGMCNLK
jgi:Spy/CpxP family protein refolding chaperone